VAASFVQNVDSGAIGAHNLTVVDMQEHPGMPEGAIAAVAGDSAVADVEGFRGN
jgi:hypothetical protein